MADHLEIEQKFDVEAAFTLPGFATVPGCASVSGPVTHHLSATYYDTAGTRLAASKITLRRRTGGTDAGWHLKLPAGAGARREVQEPLMPGDEGQVPERLAAAVAEVVGDLPLAPIAVLPLSLPCLEGKPSGDRHHSCGCQQGVTRTRPRQVAHPLLQPIRAGHA